jgi:hypothetical protein
MGWHGGCACGAVRYDVEGDAFHRTLCHCVDCRRAAGAPAVAWFSVKADALRWTAGAPALHRSSPPVERGFCGACGTQLTYRHDDYRDEIDVATASLDDPELAPPDDHTFASQRLSWLKLADGLPVYPRTRGEGR